MHKIDSLGQPTVQHVTSFPTNARLQELHHDLPQMPACQIKSKSGYISTQKHIWSALTFEYQIVHTTIQKIYVYISEAIYESKTIIVAMIL